MTLQDLETLQLSYSPAKKLPDSYEEPITILLAWSPNPSNITVHHYYPLPVFPSPLVFYSITDIEC